jgi:hypothetical protein
MANKKSIEINNKELAQKILREIPEFNAFYFFRDEGKYTGNYATSLIVFYNMLSKIDKESLLFHFKRGDFRNWIKTIIGDNQLANEIKKINKAVTGNELLERLCKIIEKRLVELKQLLANEELYLDSKKTE